MAGSAPENPGYDFFAPPRPTSPAGQPARTGTPFGAPPAAASQFGAPPAAASQFGAFAPPVAAPVEQRPAGRSRTQRLLLRLGVPLAVAAVLGLFGIGRLGVLHGLFGDDDPRLPASLNGLPRSTDDEVNALLEKTLGQLRGSFPGKVTLGAYGPVESGSGYAVLVGRSDEGTIERESFRAGLLGAVGTRPPQQVGRSTCFQDATGPRPSSFCTLVRGKVVVLVAESGQGVASASRAVDTVMTAQ